MFSVVPKDLPPDAIVAGLTPTATGERIALFRDARTAEALKGASEGVRAYFLASGFGFTTYDSGAPADRYPAADEAARIHVIERLGDNLPRYDIAGEDMNGFDFGAFMEHLAAAEPVNPDSRRFGTAQLLRYAGVGLLAAVMLVLGFGARVLGAI